MKFLRTKVALAVLLGVAAAAGVLAIGFGSASAGGDIGLEKAIAAQESHNPQLLSVPGVVGTGVGAGPNGAAILVMLERPGVGGLPGSVDGVLVIPVVTGRVYALHHCKGKHVDDPECQQPPTPTPDPGEPTPTPTPTPEPTTGSPTDRFRPAVPNGVSIGHYAITAGTLGAAVRKSDGEIVALSNAHVLAGTNSGLVGHNVMQPGPYDSTCGSCPDDIVGSLLDSEPINFSGGNNVIDAAIARIGTGISLTGSTLPGGYGRPRQTTVAPEDLQFRQIVQKYGRTTGQTQGRVWGINVTVNVNYGEDGVARFVNQIWIRGGGFSAGGDSGSLVVTSNRNPVGLLFAGGASDTFLNPIGPVLGRFDVSIVGD